AQALVSSSSHKKTVMKDTVMTTRSHLLLLQACVLFCVTSFPYDALGQNADAALLANWVALDAPTGHEHLATAPLQALYANWQHDRYGNLVR
ncbi:MAG: hypothetical protein WD772_04525, partial [Pseudohongiellaceae bacterium]